MSHYAVAVFHRKDQDINELLAPYDENLEVEPYIRFSRQEAIDYVRKNYSEAEGKSDNACWQMIARHSKTDDDGNIYSTYNPQSKWDWWSEGGRYSGMLKLHGNEVSSGRVGDLEFTIDQEAYKHALRFWDVLVDHKPAGPGEDYQTFYKEEFYRDYYGDRETYARIQSQFSTYAVITPDGVWHAPGEMGWFGCSSESGEDGRDWYMHYKERFIDAADPDWYLTIVDCHI